MLDELTNAPCSAICKPVNMARAANRLRQRLRPEDPKDLDFEIDEDCVPPGFFRADVRRKDERHLIFAREEQLETLARAKSWYGKFKGLLTAQRTSTRSVNLTETSICENFVHRSS